MKRIAASILVAAMFSILIASVCTKQPDDFFASTLYTVIGIMFSIGFGLIVTFNISGVKNQIYITKIRKTIYQVRNSFLIHFSLATLYFSLNQYIPASIKRLTFHEVSFDFSIFFCFLMIYSLIFFISNFLAVQKLNEDIIDKINEEDS